MLLFEDRGILPKLVVVRCMVDLVLTHIVLVKVCIESACLDILLILLLACVVIDPDRLCAPCLNGFNEDLSTLV